MKLTIDIDDQDRFEDSAQAPPPLCRNEPTMTILRPTTLDEVVGQNHLILSRY